MLIDCHVHLNNYHVGHVHPTEDNVARLFHEMKRHNVDHSVVLTSYTVGEDRPSVERVMELLAGDPRVTLVEGLRWRGDHRTDLFALEERIRDGQVKGVKLYPGYEPYSITDPSLEAVFRIAGKHKVPVMIHTGDTYRKQAKLRNAHPLLVDDVAVDYPDVTFVICHLGNPWFRDTAQVLYKNDNVVADISGLTLGQFSSDFEKYVLAHVREMVTYMGNPARQLMYGSDWPLVEMGPYIKFLDSLGLSDDVMEAVRWRSAARVFGIPTA